MSLRVGVCYKGAHIELLAWLAIIKMERGTVVKGRLSNALVKGHSIKPASAIVQGEVGAQLL
ncbi:hypothetical protein D3C80_1269370 [compost metagenome]